MSDLSEQFGQIDIFTCSIRFSAGVTIAPDMRILDAGFAARAATYSSIFYALATRFSAPIQTPRPFPLFAAWLDPPPTISASKLSRKCAFPDAFCDVVISSAVLHFARSDEHFRIHAGWNLARTQAGWAFLLPPRVPSIGLEHQIKLGRRPPLSSARRFRTLVWWMNRSWPNWRQASALNPPTR